MSQRVLLLHGWGGSDAPHWQSYVAAEIARDYGNVHFLRFENFDAPSLKVWMQQLKEALAAFKPDVVVCHSLANTLWFHLCNEQEIALVERLYLVAPPNMACGLLELQEFFPLLVPKNIYAKKALLITSTDDPYMRQEEAKELQTQLGIKMIVLENAGHINAESGYTQWQWMLQEIQKGEEI